MIGWAIEALVASTVLMVLVLLLRGPVRRAFGPDVAYALWVLPPLRLLLPPLPAEWHEAVARPIANAGETITIYVAEPLGMVSAATSVDTVALLMPVGAGLWVAGAVAFLGWHTAQHLRFCRRMLTYQIRGSEIGGGIHLIETEAASGPLAFGILRRYVAFPRDFIERYDQEERDLALAHELGHHARGDLFANWLALGVLALHWFNPVAWRAFRAFRADQEIANDARVLAGLSAVARHSYACAIVKSAHGGAVSAACHLHTIDDLKGRLKMLTTDRTSRRRMLGGTAAVAVLTLAALGLTASGTQAAASMRDGVERATGVDWAAFDAAPPVAPAPPSTAELPVPPRAAELPEPPAPPAPPANARRGENREVTTTTTTGPDGTMVKRIKVIVRDQHGRVRTDHWEGMADIGNMPEIGSRACTGSDRSRQMVINEQRGEKRKIIVCTNRIAATVASAVAAAGASAGASAGATAGAGHGAMMAANSAHAKRDALQAARAGLTAARRDIAGNADMSALARREAMRGIDEAMAEVAADLATAD